MMDRLRTFALVLAAATALPAAAQAHWWHPCGCQHAPAYYAHRSHDYARPVLAEELTKNVFAIPYRLRHYPYVSGYYGYGGRGIAGVGASMIGHEPIQSRVIDADAKVNIIGPDRMTIQLYRKGRGVIIHGDEYQ